jgi:prepilin-type N-terminal cleavage/methylation domain-containing protein
MATSSFFPSAKRAHRGAPGFTLMEMLVVAAIILVLLAIAFPIYTSFRKRQHKQVALEKMKDLGSAIAIYANQNGGLLPQEDAGGDDTWQIVASPAAKDAWYNALPRALGKKGAGDYTHLDFYSDENLLFLPGGNYPDKKKLIQPQFAIAYNTKLERKDAQGKKERLKLAQVSEPSRTVALLEQGLLNEKRTLPVQTKTDYDGSPKGSAKSFVGRYSGEGVLCFIDGHVQLAKAADLLTATGDMPFPPTDVIWTATPAENPNKDGTADPKKKKKEK